MKPTSIYRFITIISPRIICPVFRRFFSGVGGGDDWFDLLVYIRRRVKRKLSKRKLGKSTQKNIVARFPRRARNATNKVICHFKPKRERENYYLRKPTT